MSHICVTVNSCITHARAAARHSFQFQGNAVTWDVSASPATVYLSSILPFAPRMWLLPTDCHGRLSHCTAYENCKKARGQFFLLMMDSLQSYALYRKGLKGRSVHSRYLQASFCKLLMDTHRPGWWVTCHTTEKTFLQGTQNGPCSWTCQRENCSSCREALARITAVNRHLLVEARLTPARRSA